MTKKIAYTEADLVELLNLTRVTGTQIPEMKRWLTVQPPVLDIGEKATFERILDLAVRDISIWGEEELKMIFISHILPLGHIESNNRYKTFYEKTVTGVVDGVTLTAKTDFMLATAILNKHKKPYFHFQEYKPSRNPTGDSMAQLLEAMLIAQEKNKNGKPIYGVEIIGADWRFVVLKDKTYCISEPFISIKKDGLLSIIAILRHFKHILETELLDDI